MGTAESKGNHRHRSNKHFRHKNETPIIHKCHHKNQKLEKFNVENKNSIKRKNETIVPLITSSPVNPNLQGSILNHSFPLQRAHSEIRISPYEVLHHETISSNQFDSTFVDDSKGIYDYRKHMQRVDEENRPVLERLCPDKMYVSTNDLRICDTQRLPPPVPCKIVQGFFRPIPPPQFNKKTRTNNSAFL